MGLQQESRFCLQNRSVVSVPCKSGDSFGIFKFMLQLWDSAPKCLIYGRIMPTYAKKVLINDDWLIHICVIYPPSRTAYYSTGIYAGVLRFGGYLVKTTGCLSFCIVWYSLYVRLDQRARFMSKFCLSRTKIYQQAGESVYIDPKVRFSQLDHGTLHRKVVVSWLSDFWTPVN